jgi:hypothetical protein
MSGLNSLVSDTSTTSTTMPTWYDNAQQKLVSDATTAATNTPKLADTVAGTAINTLSNPNTNPFTQAQGSLSSIAQGAANPWLTNPATGAVTPNTNTAMGGLFQAQNDQLHTLLPQYEAPATAGSIAGGNFGSLRGQTAANTAVTGAQADLFSKQMAAALQNQQTGVAAGTGLGDVGAKGVATEATLGKAQQADPWTTSGNMAKILSTVNAPLTTTNATQLSGLSQMGALTKAFDTNPRDIANNVGGILDKIFGKSGSSSDSGGTSPVVLPGIPGVPDYTASTPPSAPDFNSGDWTTPGGLPPSAPDFNSGNWTSGAPINNSDYGSYNPNIYDPGMGDYNPVDNNNYGGYIP